MGCRKLRNSYLKKNTITLETWTISWTVEVFWVEAFEEVLYLSNRHEVWVVFWGTAFRSWAVLRLWAVRVLTVQHTLHLVGVLNPHISNNKGKLLQYANWFIKYKVMLHDIFMMNLFYDWSKSWTQKSLSVLKI